MTRKATKISAALLAALTVASLLAAMPVAASARSAAAQASTQPKPGSPYLYSPDGTRESGWLELNGNWYYINSDGTAATGWLTHKESRYYLNADGVMVTGWLNLDDDTYYFHPDGAMATGWIQDGDYWYFFNSDGTMDPDIKDSSDWMLMLVNDWNPIPEDFKPKVKSLPNGHQFDSRAIDSLSAMLSAARSEGLSPVVISGYRSTGRQQALFANKVIEIMRKGLNREQAEAEARTIVAYPGRSEHGIGLAADIVSSRYRQLNERQETTPEVQWLTANCAEYGFILRYPKGKEDITGIIYEPWHFRYVGTDAAREIMNSGLCLEEYLSR